MRSPTREMPHRDVAAADETDAPGARGDRHATFAAARSGCDEGGRLADAFLPFHVRVLVLDAQHTVEADRLEGLDEGLPEVPVVADSQRAEVPCPVRDTTVPSFWSSTPAIASRSGSDLVSFRWTWKIASRSTRIDGQRIHLLPEQVRWVEIRPDDGTDGIPHPLQGRHVVDELQGVQLERDPLDTVVPRMRGQVQPQRDRLVPLATEQGCLVIGPGDRTRPS